MKLTEQERNSALWRSTLVPALETRLALLRAQLEGTALGKKQTAVLRGRIAEVKAILSLDKDEPLKPPPSDG